MSRCHFALLPVALTIIAANAAAGSDPAEIAGASLGAIVGSSGNKGDYALVIEGQHHFRQRKEQFDFRQYGHGESRLELGNAVTLSMSATSGIQLLGFKDGRTLAPHFGIEPFSGSIVWSSKRERDRHYEWNPMTSAGAEFAFGSCHLLPLLRGGMALGNRATPGWQPHAALALGAGTFLNCERIDLALEGTRYGASNAVAEHRTDSWLLDLSTRIGPNHAKIGLRGEALLSNTSERRILLVWRSGIPGIY